MLVRIPTSHGKRRIMANAVHRRIFDDVSMATSQEKWVRRDVFDVFARYLEEIRQTFYC